MVDSRNSNQLLYLPFDKLMQQVDAGRDGAAHAARERAAPMRRRRQPTTDAPRDSLRRRDREAPLIPP